MASQDFIVSPIFKASFQKKGFVNFVFKLFSHKYVFYMRTGSHILTYEPSTQNIFQLSFLLSPNVIFKHNLMVSNYSLSSLQTHPLLSYVSGK